MRSLLPLGRAPSALPQRASSGRTDRARCACLVTACLSACGPPGVAFLPFLETQTALLVIERPDRPPTLIPCCAETQSLKLGVPTEKATVGALIFDESHEELLSSHRFEPALPEEPFDELGKLSTVTSGWSLDGSGEWVELEQPPERLTKLRVRKPDDCPSFDAEPIELGATLSAVSTSYPRENEIILLGNELAVDGRVAAIAIDAADRVQPLEALGFQGPTEGFGFCVLIDSTRTTWVCLRDGGIAKLERTEVGLSVGIRMSSGRPPGRSLDGDFAAGELDAFMFDVAGQVIHFVGTEAREVSKFPPAPGGIVGGGVAWLARGRGLAGAASSGELHVISDGTVQKVSSALLAAGIPTIETLSPTSAILSTANGSLLRFDGETLTTVSEPALIGHIKSIVVSDVGFWLGTSEGRLAILRPDEETVCHVRSLATKSIRDIHPRIDGSFVVVADEDGAPGRLVFVLRPRLSR
ncbi:MAG: hypothetical protein HYV07_08955 [Deltaproteobacteria bacterium]|nr:hypothetical protein [Deltaproteobacteria bacterium]